MSNRSLVKEVAEHYTGGKSAGVEHAEGLAQAAKDMVAKIDNGKIKPGEVHVGQLFESFVNYPGSKLRQRAGELAANSPDARDVDIVNAITASEFPFITGKLIHNTLIPEYKEEVGPLERLVREEDSDRKIVDVAGTMGTEEPELTLEGQTYELTTDSEKRVTIRTHKFGRRLAVTRELITFDKTGGQILARARNAGKNMGRHRATWIAEGVQDKAITATGQAANTMFNYNGTDRAIYQNDHSSVDSQTNDNNITDALSTQGLQTARVQLRSMTDFYGKKLRLRGTQLFIAENLFVEAHKLVEGITDPDQANPNAANVFKGRITEVISDPEVTTNNWFYGDFPEMFLWLWIWRPAVEEIPGDPAADIMLAIKYGYYAGFGASDYRQVVKSDGSA